MIPPVEGDEFWPQWPATPWGWSNLVKLMDVCFFHRNQIFSQASKRWCKDVFGEQLLSNCNLYLQFVECSPRFNRAGFVGCSFERFQGFQYWCRRYWSLDSLSGFQSHQTWVGFFLDPNKPAPERSSTSAGMTGRLPSKKLTYPTVHGKFGKSSTQKCRLVGDMLVPGKTRD